MLGASEVMTDRLVRVLALEGSFVLPGVYFALAKAHHSNPDATTADVFQRLDSTLEGAYGYVGSAQTALKHDTVQFEAR